MKDRSARRPFRRGVQLDSLETRATMSHVPAAVLAAEALRVERAELQTLPIVTTSPGAGDVRIGPGRRQSIPNAIIYTNYIGGTVGLEAFVAGLYVDVLHRPPDTAGEVFWTNRLQLGTYTPYTVVSFFLTSSEAVAQGGSGEPLHPTVPPPNIYTAYLGGNVGVTAFVDGLYINVLHSAPDAAGEAYWVSQIEGPAQLLPAKVTFSFLASAEHQARLDG